MTTFYVNPLEVQIADLCVALRGLLEFVAEEAPLADPRVDAAETALAKAEAA